MQAKLQIIIVKKLNLWYIVKRSNIRRYTYDSNILAMGADDVSISEAICILRMWLATEFEGGRHEERLRIIEEIENENMK